MRILLVGQAAFAAEVLQRLEAAGDAIAAVVCPPDAPGKPEPLKQAAEARGVPGTRFGSYRRRRPSRQTVCAPGCGSQPRIRSWTSAAGRPQSMAACSSRQSGS